MFKKLYDYLWTLSGFNAQYILVFKNGKIKHVKTDLDFTEKELNAKVLNIFAVGKDVFEIHLTKLPTNKELKGDKKC